MSESNYQKLRDEEKLEFWRKRLPKLLSEYKPGCWTPMVGRDLHDLNHILIDRDQLQAENERLRVEVEQLEGRLDLEQGVLDSKCADSERLWQWARETLTGEVSEQFWQIAANGYLMSENPEYHQRMNSLKHQVDRLRQREQTIAKALGVCDGGEYLNDIVAAVERLQSANSGLRTTLAEIQNCVTEASQGTYTDWHKLHVRIPEMIGQALAQPAPGVERQRKLEAVYEAAKKHHDLMKDPQIGLATWHMAVECISKTLDDALAAVELEVK